MRAMVVLTPSESKRFIAKAIARKKEVQDAMERAYIILCEGTTNSYIASELFGVSVSSEHFTSGVNSHGILCNSARSERGTFPLIAYKGKLVDMDIRSALDHFHRETVFIKGANAVDASGLAGVIVSGYTGGSMAAAVGTCVSQGIRIICPVGLEKTVFSVVEAAKHTGGKRFDYSMGSDFGLFVIPQADVVTEIEAVGILTGACAVQIAAGGIDGSEGAVVLSIEGTNSSVQTAVDIIESVKGEPSQKAIRMKCTDCKYVNCRFYMKEENNLPNWMIQEE